GGGPDPGGPDPPAGGTEHAPARGRAVLPRAPLVRRAERSRTVARHARVATRRPVLGRGAASGRRRRARRRLMAGSVTGRLLDGWPRDVPLVVECQDPTWHVDEVLGLLRGAGAAWCTTELDEDAEPPPVHVTGDRLYLRLRRTAYDRDELGAWAKRIVPFI